LALGDEFEKGLDALKAGVDVARGVTQLLPAAAGLFLHDNSDETRAKLDEIRAKLAATDAQESGILVKTVQILDGLAAARQGLAEGFSALRKQLTNSAERLEAFVRDISSNPTLSLAMNQTSIQLGRAEALADDYYKLLSEAAPHLPPLDKLMAVKEPLRARMGTYFHAPVAGLVSHFCYLPRIAHLLSIEYQLAVLTTDKSWKDTAAQYREQVLADIADANHKAGSYTSLAEQATSIYNDNMSRLTSSLTSTGPFQPSDSSEDALRSVRTSFMYYVVDRYVYIVRLQDARDAARDLAETIRTLLAPAS